jgi:signal transduction histidine kinase
MDVLYKSSSNSALDSQCQLLKIPLYHIPLGVAIFDQEFVLRHCNSIWASFVSQYIPSSAGHVRPGIGLVDLMPGAEVSFIPLFKRAVTGEVVHQEAVQLKSNDQVSYWDMALAPLIENGQRLGVVNVMAEVTERVVAQQALEQLYQQVHQSATLTERDRLARALHDRLAQALGYINLKSSLANDLLTTGQIHEAQTHLLELKHVTQETYTDVREAIFNLRTKVDAGVNFLPMLHDYLAEYQMQYGLNTQVLVEAEVLVEFSDEVSAQIIRIIQEALSNVRRHARASQVIIRFAPEDDQVCLTIEDDGQGFDPEQPTREDRLSFGLDIMRERAESIGGWMEIDAAPNRGTRLVVWAPRMAEG